MKQRQCSPNQSERQFIAKVSLLLSPDERAHSLWADAIQRGGCCEEAYGAAPGHLQAAVIFTYCMYGLAPDRWRKCLSSKWLRDHHSVKEVGTASGLSVPKLFRAARFPLPEALPPFVTAWRGAVGISASACRGGLSWTTDFGDACWMATGLLRARGFNPGLPPIVLRRTLRRKEILFYDDRSEGAARAFEIVAAAGSGEVDGTPAQWQAAADEWARCRLNEYSIRGTTNPSEKLERIATELASRGIFTDAYIAEKVENAIRELSMQAA